jgi:hypothetical protein
MLTLILNQIKAYWQLAVGLIIIVVILWGGYELHHSGYQEAKAEDQKIFDAQQELIKQSKIDNANLIANLEETKNANQQTINTIFERINSERVLLPEGCPGQANSPGGSEKDTSRARVLFPPVGAEQKGLDDFMGKQAELAKEADEMLESCRVIQTWANR